MTQLSRLPQIVESPQSLEPAGLCVVPPMELHEIERIDFEAPQRAVDDRLHVPTVDPGQEIEIGHELCMNPHPLCRLRPAGRENPRARLPVEVFDAGVDVGAIEGENACVEGDDEIIDGADPIDLSVPPGKLPPAADEARNRITRRQFDGLDAASSRAPRGQGRRGRFGAPESADPDAADPQPASAVRVRDRRSRVARHPVVAMGRPLLGGQQRQDGGNRVDGEPLSGRQRQHLAA